MSSVDIADPVKIRPWDQGAELSCGEFEVKVR